MTDRLVEDIRRVRRALARYRVTAGKGFDLDAHRSDDLADGLDKGEAHDLLRSGIDRLNALQELLYASGTWSLLVIFQAMDAGGKDSTIKHVMSGVNPQGVSVTSFKAPGARELAHDFLWRISQALPARGTIGIFNRSHYEDVLVARVHKPVLAAAHLPERLVAADGFWRHRIADIGNFEDYLGRQGTVVVKFFLNVGRDEQKRRFLKRLDTPGKSWKFDAGDLKERASWGAYRKAYAAAIAGTATPAAPWYVIPADRKWYMRLAVAEAIVLALEGLDLSAPKPDPSQREALAAARRALAGE